MKGYSSNKSFIHPVNPESSKKIYIKKCHSKLYFFVICLLQIELRNGPRIKKQYLLKRMRIQILFYS